MDRLILALLKLLLQLVIFLLTGHWPKIERGQKPTGRMQPSSAPARTRKQGQRAAPSAAEARDRSRTSAARGRGKRALFDVETRAGARERRDVEARAGAREWNDEVARAAGAQPGADMVAQPSRERRRAPAAARSQVRGALSPELGRRPLAHLLRDPSAIRDAVVLGAALGVRKPSR